jgi:uncharacterized protein YecE (DUF72 family)
VTARTRDQLSLVGAETVSGVGVETKDDPEARALAAELPPHIRFGTSSWTFAGWSNILWKGTPTHAELVETGLRAYARHPLLATVGIDRSYYGPLTREDLTGYASQLPPGFLAVSKVWEEITTYVFPNHPRFGARAGQRNPRFLDPTTTLEEVIGPYLDAFADHAGPFVFELPPMPRDAMPEEEDLARRIERLMRALPRRFSYAFELRNRELLTARYLDVLRANGAGHVLNYWSAMPTLRAQLDLPGVLTAPFVVARLLLPPGTRYQDRKADLAPFDRIAAKDPTMRADIVRLARACALADKALFVLVNNKAEGCAPLTIRALAEAIVLAQRGATPHTNA